MPIRYVKCGTCSGTGHELEMGEETCSGCGGSGRDKTSDLWSEPCRTCNGKRKVTYCRRSPHPCRDCGGKGTKEIKY